MKSFQISTEISDAFEERFVPRDLELNKLTDKAANCVNFLL